MTNAVGALKAQEAHKKLVAQIEEMFYQVGAHKMTSVCVDTLKDYHKKGLLKSDLIIQRKFNIGKTFREKVRKVTFMVFHPEKCPDGLIMECRSQDTPGTMPDRVAGMYLDIIHSDYDGIIVLEGSGLHLGSERRWLKREIAQNDLRLKAVFDLEELQKYIKEEFADV